MNNGTPYGLSMTLSGVAMLCFGYFAFMGLNYHFEGDLLWPVTLVVSGAMVLIWSLAKMCKSKLTKDRKHGMPAEVGSAIVALCVLGLGCLPFTQFVKILEHKEELQMQLQATVESAREIGSEYSKYAGSRVDNFKENLYSLDYSEYNRITADIPGSSKAQKINALYMSLRRRLLPETLNEVDSARNAWLNEVADVNVWNIRAPKNIYIIGNVGKTWVAEYRSISSEYYEGDEAEPFEMPLLDGSLGDYNRNFTQFSMPNVLSILAALLCFGMIMIPYMITRRSRSFAVGTHED